MSINDLLPYLNIPVVICVVKIAIEAGKWKYLAKHIEEHCCITTLKCPLGMKGGETHGTEKKVTAPKEKRAISQAA